MTRTSELITLTSDQVYDGIREGSITHLELDIWIRAQREAARDSGYDDGYAFGYDMGFVQGENRDEPY